MEIGRIITENKKRNAVLDEPYNPITGFGSPIERQEVRFSELVDPLYLPVGMLNVDWVNSMVSEFSNISDAAKYIGTTPEQLLFEITQERYKHDFEFWSATTIIITNKDTFQDFKFVLRGAQRILLLVLEKMRLSGVPIRIVLLKARQWGGSTLVQIYMMWIQQIHRKNWHLAVCAQDDSAAKNIRGLYTNAASKYPDSIGTITLKPYEGSTKNRVCVERGGIIGVGSINNPDQFRSYNFAMVHLSEVGVWQDTPKRTAKDLITSLKETVPDVPYSMIVEESTAKGLNYFYDSWKRALRPNNRIEAVFIPWYKIDRCRIEIEEELNDFCQNMSQYDWFLWEQGATLEGIAWYNKHKADRYEEEETKNQMFSEWQMQQENPTTPEEAFRSAGEKRFNPKYIKAMEQDCLAPSFIGEVTGDSTQGDKAFNNLEFIANNKGNLSIWSFPDNSIKVNHRYVAFVDIGGVWRGADFSTIVIIDRYWMIDGGDPEVVAVYRGHMDKDLFGWYAAQVAYMYNEALLAFETNSLDKDRNKDDHFQTVIEKIAPYYRNLYVRNNPEKVGDDYVPLWGWHTNKKTKPGMIDNLYAASRERYLKDQDKSDGYALIVRDVRITKEMNWYEKKEDGTLGAVQGEHDDLCMATAGAYTIAVEKMPMPKIIDHTGRVRKKIIRGESSF